jgi:hypothetical protein
MGELPDLTVLRRQFMPSSTAVPVGSLCRLIRRQMIGFMHPSLR